MGNVDPATADALQTDGQSKTGRGTIVSERDQQVKVRVVVLVASCQRAVEHGQTNPMLGPQRPSEGGQKWPMCTEVFALAWRQVKPARPAPVHT